MKDEEAEENKKRDHPAQEVIIVVALCMHLFEFSTIRILVGAHLYYYDTVADCSFLDM